MNVYVNNISVPRIARNKRVYTGYASNVSTGGSGIVAPGKAIVEFEDTDTPEVLDYNTKYAPVYGQTPTFELYQNYTDDESKVRRRKLTAEPDIILNQTTLLIESVGFGQWGEQITGFITISR